MFGHLLPHGICPHPKTTVADICSGFRVRFWYTVGVRVSTLTVSTERVSVMG